METQKLIKTIIRAMFQNKNRSSRCSKVQTGSNVSCRSAYGKADSSKHLRQFAEHVIKPMNVSKTHWIRCETLRLYRSAFIRLGISQHTRANPSSFSKLSAKRRYRTCSSTQPRLNFRTSGTPWLVSLYFQFRITALRLHYVKTNGSVT